MATFSAGLDLDGTVRRLAQLMIEVTAADVCFVHVLDETGRRLVLAGGTPPFDELAGTIELAVGEGVAGWVALHGEPAVVEDKWSDPRYRYFPELRGENYASLLSVPMVSRPGHLVGVLNVHSESRRHFSPDKVSLVGHVANLMAGAVENARLYTRLAEREEAVERFAQHTLELQEAERQRLAAEIHDGISQRIVSLHYHLCAAAETLPPESAQVATQIGAARDLAAAALDEARSAIGGLRPPLLDDLGLGACLRGLARDLPPGISADVEVDTSDLDAHVETAIYRMAQEALQNVVKHARASHVRIELRSLPHVVQVLVVDDGIGFAPEAVVGQPGGTRYGLTGMRARADLVGAELRIDSTPGKGTRVSITVPVSEPLRP
ncbi:MAG TPA: GAF domain-containing sensor histidine kinase [Candidatus Dormibacteraeota bacterium]|nr:GAF domain-containing sensor histidine kinase [Candidatus Dormibacteraeota bacterium]